MLALILGALRARRAQAAALLLLSALAAGSAAAAPWYVLGAWEGATAASIESAPPAERLIQMRRPVTLNSPLSDITDVQVEEATSRLGLGPAGGSFTVQTRSMLVGRALPPNQGPDRSGGASGTFASRGADPTGVTVPFRQTTSALVAQNGACDKVVVDGECPDGPGEAMVSMRTSAWLNLGLGDTVMYEATEIPNRSAAFKIVGVYRPANLGDLFWTGQEMVAAERAAGSPDQVEPVDDAILVSESALEAVKPTTIIHIVHLTATGQLLVNNSAAEVFDQLRRGTNALAAGGFVIRTDLAQLVNRVEDEQRLMLLGVPIGALQLLVLCWFALYLAIKYTGDERRPDIGLLKLRGTRRPRMWLLLTGQSGVPMLLGAVAGVFAGAAAGRYFGGEITRPESTRLAAVLAASAAALAVLGAFVAALVAERRSLAAPVVDLLRQVPARRRAWRDAADLVLVAIAVAALFQVEVATPGTASGLALVAPGLAALAVALVVARITTRLAASAGAEALRSGRPVAALTAIYLARRPGVPRLCALLVVAVALLGTSVLTWDAGTRSAELRAGLELGAKRVLTVQADNRSHLLDAVRAADPEGRYAMAAAEFTGSDRVLLVDSPRLAAVADWHPEYGAPTAAEAAKLLRGNVTTAPQIKVAGAAVTVELTYAGVPTPPGTTVWRPYLQLTLAGERGRRLAVRAGPLADGRQTVRLAVPECAKAPHCRLVSLGFVGTANGVVFLSMPAGASLALHRMDQAEPAATLLDAAAFADRARWRPTASAQAPSLAFGPEPGTEGLRATVAADLNPGPRRDNGVYPFDAPSPVPVLKAGTSEADSMAGDPRMRLFQSTVPVTVVATASLVPRLGERGTLADLEYADRLGSDFGGAESLQVWLSPDAPASVVTRLTEQGLRIGVDRTLDDAVSGYLRQAPPVALRFQLGSALVGLLLAAGAVAVVAAVERRSRVAELAALRAQGASVRLVRRAAAGGHLVLLAISVLVGAATALAVRAYAGDLIPFFADGWSMLAPGPVPRADLLAFAVGAVALTLGGAGLLATSQLARKVR